MTDHDVWSNLQPDTALLDYSAMKIDPKALYTATVRWFEWLFLLPLFSGVTASAGVAAGVLGAHYDKEVWASWYPFFAPGHEFSSEASSVWLAAAVFGLCFGGTFWAQGRSAREATEGLLRATKAVDDKTLSLTTKTESLDGLVRQLYTLPPKGFLVEYKQAVGIAHEAFFSVDGLESPAPPDELAAAIRVLLTCVLGLARSYDSDGDTAAYGCNLMLFMASAVLSRDEAASVDSRMKFVDDGVTVFGLPGALVLASELSVSSSSAGGPDASLGRLALPIPNPEGAGNLLPGAPLAFVKKTEAVVEGVDDWMLQSKAFSEPVRVELKAFIENPDNPVKSFVSIPLFAHDADPNAPPLGILNIHRSKPNQHLAEKMELLSPLISPISSLLSRLLWTYASKAAIL